MKKILFLLLSISLFAACKGDTTKTSTSTESSEVSKSTVPSGTAYKIDSKRSIVNWKGTKLTGEHVGFVKVSDGTIYRKDGKVIGGNVVIDMNSITNTDLSGDDKSDLEGHLKGTNDFFDVATFPTAKFEITKVIEVKNSKSTHMAMGNLIIKGISKPVGIPCNITDIGASIHVSSKGFEIDRTKWGINYKSKSIFPNIKDKFINDKIGFDLELTASK